VLTLRGGTASTVNVADDWTIVVPLVQLRP
jgi:hypothetical protein